MSKPVSLGQGIYQLELSSRSGKHPISGYVITGEKNWIVETGPSSCLDVILAGLEALGLKPEQIDGIIVTHVHLDHSGAVGLLAQHCTEATVYAHPRGTKHLINPTLLEQGARMVYGDSFDRLFAPIVPVDEHRVVPTPDQFRLEIGPGRALVFYDAPGHCLHHSFIWDGASKGIFSGDAAGMYYAEAAAVHGVDLCLPATTPVQFDPVAMKATLNAMKALGPQKLYFTHFGAFEPAELLLEHTEHWIDLYAEKAADLYRETRQVEPVFELIVKQVRGWLAEQGVEGGQGLAGLEFDSQLNAQGVAAYVKYQEKLAST